MTDFIKLDVVDGIATMTMNSPATRNAVAYDEQHSAIADACHTITKDRAVRCVILTGAGTAFSAGGDIKGMLQRLSDPNLEAIENRYLYKEGIHRIPVAIYDLEVPVIAAVNGPAIGAGLDLACMCDIRIAGRSAKFAESFVTLGIIPGDGGAYFLQRLVGPSKAAELTFTGRTIGADEALACGLVSSVVDDAELMDKAREMAAQIARNPGYALRMSKRLMREAQDSNLKSVLELSAAFQALSHATGEHKELLSAAVARLKR